MDKLWWTTIPSAGKFAEDIAEVLINGKSVVYTVDRNLPWSLSFSEVLSSKIEGSDKGVDIFYSDEIDQASPGEFIFKKYCKPELKAKYRSAMSYERFLALNYSSTVLVNKYIYIRNCNKAAAELWTDFICKYNSNIGKDGSGCSFIIENCSEYMPNCGVANFQWSNYYHRYDISMLCLLKSSEIKANDLIKSYMAELACTLSDNDAELAAELVSTGIALIDDTEKTMKKVVETRSRSDGSVYTMPDNIATYIKEVQVKIFYPVIERYRTWFINENIEQFTSDFRYTTSYGDEITDCHDLELGDLVYLCYNFKLNVSSDSFRELKSFHNYRNNLAHRSLLSPDDIRKLSDYSFGDCAAKSRSLCYS